MGRKTLPLTDVLYQYVLDVSLRESEVARDLRAETARLPNAEMQSAPEQGQFMGLLVHLLGVRRALEIGVFTGYSALAVAEALPPDGRLVACDLSEEFTAIARRYWARAGVAGKIDLRLAPAVETLDALLAEGQAGTFDFAFIDADKERYDAYYERALSLLRPGGLLLIDNVLWGGEVADPSADTPALRAIRALNLKLRDDERVDLSLLPLADGVSLVRKR